MAETIMKGGICAECGRHFLHNWVRYPLCSQCREAAKSGAVSTAVQTLPKPMVITNTRALQQQMVDDFNWIQGVEPMIKKLYYMGAETLHIKSPNPSVPTYETLEEAIKEVSGWVERNEKVRYIVKIVAMVEPAPRPVKVTMLPIAEMED